MSADLNSLEEVQFINVKHNNSKAIFVPFKS